MAAVGRICGLEMQRSLSVFKNFRNLFIDTCKYSTAPNFAEKPKGRLKRNRLAEVESLSRYAQVYPEFLPNPDPRYRHPLREKLERRDMLARRKVLDIPEFYVGSIVAVTISDINAPGKTNRFLGIVIDKKGAGLKLSFTLRNVIDHQGVEVTYNLYDPTIQMIECLRLEKRLDNELHYLRDAPNEYSTFPLDMEPEYLPEGSKVPVNKLLVPLNPRPYIKRWERHDFKGMTNLDVGYKRKIKMEKYATPWMKHDLMKIYRETIPDEDRLDIFRDIHQDLDILEKDHRRKVRQAMIRRSKK